MRAAPTLETARLRLRAHRADDFDAYARMWADPLVVRFIGGTPATREAAWTRFLRHAGLWQVLGFGFFAVDEKATGRFVGQVGFQELRREMVPSIEGTMEAGWALDPSAHGHGYAEEAMRAALAWADTRHRGVRITCIIAPENRASLRVAGKLGFSEAARTTYQDGPIVVLERAHPAASAPASEARKCARVKL